MNRFFIAILATCFCNPTIHAADVQVAVSSGEAYVGFPITLQVRIDNASKDEKPEINDVDGLKIEFLSVQSQNSRMFDSYGQFTTTTSSTYQWSVTPTREGTFTIPPIPVRADGISSITKAVRIKASKSDAGDLLIAEIETNQDSVYVGEPIELSLKIYVKAYIDEDADINLSDESMWGLLSKQTQWGLFGERIEQLTMNRMQPRGNEVTRKDADGKDAKYYRYQVDATLYPSRPGPVDLGEIKVSCVYPLEISRPNRERRSRSPFDSMFGGSFFGGSRATLNITKSQPLLVEPKLGSVVAKQIPTDGQPKEFAGAVGRYVIEVLASDTSVQAGDPVELTIRIRGTGQMDTIAAPPLSLIDAVSNDFKVTDQPLAGQVDRDQKVFTTTVRPKDETVTEIPAIPFSYFDPSSGEYETCYSEPIPIIVTPADVLKLDKVARVDAKTPKTQSPELMATSSESGLQLNLAWNDLNENKDRTKLSLGNIVIPAMLLPPFVFLIGALMRGYVAINRRTASESKTLHKIKSADQASEMAAAMNRYFSLRWKISLPDSSDGELSMDHILGHLRSVGQHRFAVRLEQWKDRTTQNHPATEAEFESLRESALKIVRDAKSQRKTPSRRVASALILFGVFASTCGHAVAIDSLPSKSALNKSALNKSAPTGSRAMIERAESDYSEGEFISTANLLDSVKSEHSANTDLFVNIGNAWWQSGDMARAKSSFLRALEIDPTDDIARLNLLAVEDSSWLLQKCTSPPMRLVLLFAIAAWALLWTTLALRLWTAAFPWRSIAAICLMITLVAGGIAALQINCVWFPHHAVIVADDVKLHSGDGDSFDVVQTIANGPGQVVRWIAKRPGWVQVITSDGIVGWLPDGSVEIVSGLH